MANKDVFTLLDAIHVPLNRPEYVPGDGLTHCNSYVAEVCAMYGCKGLDGLLANQIINLLEGSPNWSPVPIDRCQDLANAGSLIVCGLRDDPHGHVNIICPGKPKNSGRWGTVPSCANVGKEVFVGKGINWAFQDLPKAYAWRNSL